MPEQSRYSDNEAYDVIRMGFIDLVALRRTVCERPSLLNARTGLNETPLHYLVIENQIDAVMTLIDLGASVKVSDFRGATPLHSAATLGLRKAIRLLLEHGADVDARDQDSQTPLHNAALAGKADVIRILVDAGADVNANATLYETALDDAILRHHDVAATLLRSLGGMRGTGILSQD